MQAILSLVAEFITSESGAVPPRTGLPVAWTAGVLVAAAVVLGTPETSAAHCGAAYHYFPNYCYAWKCYNFCHNEHGCDTGVCIDDYNCACT